MDKNFDKGRKDEVHEILSMMKQGSISKEEGEQRLRSYSDQLVEAAREAYEKNWKASFNVKNMVIGNTGGDMTKKAVIGRMLILFLGCYTVFAGAVIALTHIRFRLENHEYCYIQLGTGILGIILGMFAIRLFKAGTLLCACWAFAVWHYFPIWIVPVPVFGIILFGFIFQLIVQKGKQNPTPVLGLTGVFLSAALLVNAFLSELFYKTREKIEIDAPIDLPEKLPETVSVNYLFAGAGVLALVIGIIFLVIFAKKRPASE